MDHFRNDNKLPQPTVSTDKFAFRVNVQTYLNSYWTSLIQMTVQNDSHTSNSQNTVQLCKSVFVFTITQYKFYISFTHTQLWR